MGKRKAAGPWASETTAASYAECVAAGACKSDGLDCAAQATFGKAERQNHPIVCVTFEQATAYCSHRGKRLPLRTSGDGHAAYLAEVTALDRAATPGTNCTIS